MSERLFLGFAHHFCKHIHIPGLACSDVLAELQKINGIFAGDFLGIEGAKTQECLTAHIGGQPVAMRILRSIPEEFLFLPYGINGFYEAPGKEIGKGPDDFVHFFVQQFEIGVWLVFFDKSAGLFERITFLIFTIDDLAVLNPLVRNNHGISYPFAVYFQDRHHFADQVLRLHLVGGPHLAGDAVPHGILDAEVPGQEV